jgi:hypothetical protein
MKLATSDLSERAIVMQLSDMRMARFHQQSDAGSNPAELAGLRKSFEDFYRREISQIQPGDRAQR